jgi:hypothetical protein
MNKIAQVILLLITVLLLGGQSSYTVINVMNYGCHKDHVTDDSACFATAIAALPIGGGGVLWIEPGRYCLFSGFTIATPYVTVAMNGALLDSCGHDHYVMKAAGTGLPGGNLDRFDAWDGQIYGYNSAAATQPAIVLDHCVACRLHQVDAQFGWEVLKVTNSTYTLDQSGFGYAYGDADVVVQNSGGWCIRSAIDQGTPNGYPPIPATINAWSAGAPIASQQVVSTSTNWWLQAMNPGTSGGTEPAITATTEYGASIVDGSVTWQIVGRINHDSIRYDTGTSQSFEMQCDHSGFYRFGVNVVNTLGGTPPQYVNITDTAIGGVQSGVFVQEGGRISLNHDQIDNCIAVGCAGVSLTGTFTGIAEIDGNDISGNWKGIDIVQAGVSNINVAIVGNVITGSASGVAISVDSNTLSHYVINDNICGGGTINDIGIAPKIVQTVCP